MARETPGLFPVRFGNSHGPVNGYVPPANTGDPRSRDCRSHHLGCDCREAMVQEDMRELAADRDEWKNLARMLLREMGEDEVAAQLLNLYRELRISRSGGEVPF